MALDETLRVGERVVVDIMHQVGAEPEAWERVGRLCGGFVVGGPTIHPEDADKQGVNVLPDEADVRLNPLLGGHPRFYGQKIVEIASRGRFKYLVTGDMQAATS
jgi:hypothetical protein